MAVRTPALPTRISSSIAPSSGRLAATVKGSTSMPTVTKNIATKTSAQRQQARERLVRVVGGVDDQTREERAERDRQPHRLGERADASAMARTTSRNSSSFCVRATRRMSGGTPRTARSSTGPSTAIALPIAMSTASGRLGAPCAERGQQDGQRDDGEVLDQRDADQHLAVAGVQLAAIDQQAHEHHRAGDRDDEPDGEALQGRPAEHEAAPAPSAAVSTMPSGPPINATQRTRSRSRRENSMPMENMRRTTPISANTSNVWVSETVGPGVKRPTSTPPTRYPRSTADGPATPAPRRRRRDDHPRQVVEELRIGRHRMRRKYHASDSRGGRYAARPQHLGVRRRNPADRKPMRRPWPLCFLIGPDFVAEPPDVEDARRNGPPPGVARVILSAHPMATDPQFFHDLAWVIVAAVVGGALAWLARQPVLLGYLVAVCSSALQRPGDGLGHPHVEVFAEIASSSSCFSIGIEFSLRDCCECAGSR